MGTRMPRTPGGAKSKTINCCFGKEGERGMGRQYSGGTIESHAYKDVKKEKNRMGNTRPWAKMPDRYQAVSHNPSGASNTALRNEDRTMMDDT